ncbi:MAG: tRNA pseudouridine(55) synthase TruB [Lachnospiraceae bacterium]|nr:tRNA pseudouridine(55) synthase TruB [Lachnospiraceae bacterium]
MINGVLNIYKPRGFTSHDVVAKLRGMLKQKKIGHTGTLDPEAIGVLPVCLGNATRACDMLTDKDKEYVAVVRLGVTTDTQDMTGQILQEKDVMVTAEEVRTAVEGFLGDYDQVPPMYSALKVNGKKLYELAREGKEVERKARRIHIYEIEILKMELPGLTLRVNCSKGTYIRTLCHDLGEKLGCGAAMESLERTRSGSFMKEEAITLQELEDRVREEGEQGKEVSLEGILIPTEELFKDYPVLKLAPGLQRLIENGNSFEESALLPGLQKKERRDQSRYRVYGKNDVFMGIYEYRKKEGRFCPFKMFISR